MRVSELEGKKVAIWGLGREGRSVIEWLDKKLPGQEWTVFNDEIIEQNIFEQMNISQIPKIIIGNEIAQSLANFDIVIKSPGVSRYRPEILSVEGKVAFTSAGGLWFGEMAHRKKICITGTKGKSTTTSLVAHIFQTQGLKTALAGNIGTPLLSLPDQFDLWIIELSSYQTCDFGGEADIAALLNLYPEHLDWHGNVENYYRDKWKIFDDCGMAVANYLDGETSKRAERTTFCYFNHHSGFWSKNGDIYFKQNKILNGEEIPLPGMHNLSNINAALTITHAWGIQHQQALKAVRSFKGLQHRLYYLGQRDGIHYIDDSISTTPQSTIAALESFPRKAITLIIGGYDRGLDFSGLVDFLIGSDVHAVITLPDTGQRIMENLRQKRKKIPELLYEEQELAQAVKRAQKITAKEGIILLSPAAPSYGYFKNFEERGRFFAKAAGF